MVVITPASKKVLAMATDIAVGLCQGCTTYFAVSAKIFVEGNWGRSRGLGLVPPVGFRSKAPAGPGVRGTTGRSPPKADDDLLVQQPIFCAQLCLCRNPMGVATIERWQRAHPLSAA